MAEIKENKLRNVSQKTRKKTLIAAYRNNNKNQMKCILKGKPKIMNEYWRMPLPTAPQTTSVTVIRVIPSPMTTVGRGIDPPCFPSLAITSKNASFHYPSCSSNNEGWRHSPHDGSGEGIYPPPSPSLEIVSKDAPLLYPPCSGSDGVCRHPSHDGSEEE
jgi:hypothetical protein